jgi:phosphomannomutase/phosphoglucomutase
MKMFGTNGIRGESNGYLDCELALKIGKSIVTVLGPGPIAIAMDTRVSSDMIRSAVSAGMMSMGADVHNLGMIPTPALQYYVKTHEEVTGGVMITASHNPPEFNGIKCVSGDGTECKPEEEAAIEDAYEGI